MEIAPAVSPAGVPLDLSLSTLRSVSPIHIEYLRNMGVTASMSVSIVVRGKLWGLFACHHYSGSRVLPYSLRTVAELYAQLFALQLGQVESDIVREQAQRAQAMHDRIMAQLAESSGLVEHFDAMIALEAFSMVALVIHELLTNSVKYGSLCDSRGQVRMTLTPTTDGGLSIAWLRLADRRAVDSARIEGSCGSALRTWRS